MTMSPLLHEVASKLFKIFSFLAIHSSIPCSVPFRKFEKMSLKPEKGSVSLKSRISLCRNLLHAQLRLIKTEHKIKN